MLCLNAKILQNSPVDLKAVDSIGKRKQSQRRGSESAGLQKTQCLQPELKRRNIGRANSHPPGLGDYCKRNEVRLLIRCTTGSRLIQTIAPTGVAGF